MQHAAESERWHELLTTRYVCEICLTRFFVPHHICPACHRIGYIRPLVSMLLSAAHSDEDLRNLIAHGQMMDDQTESGGETI